MSFGLRSFSWCIAALVFLLFAIGLPQARAAQMTTVFGVPMANLRAGPGVEHAIKLTLKEGDRVVIERSEGEWFAVTVADGQQGYIHKNLLKQVDDAAVQPPAAAAPQNAASDIPAAAPIASRSQPVPAPAANDAQPPAPDSKVASAEVASTNTPDGKIPSLLQILAAHESEVKIGVLIAGVAFVIGWFCGGHYYIRREYRQRRRLRL